MRLNKSNITGPTLGLLVSLLVLFASSRELFEPFELKTLDMRSKLFNQNRPLDDRIRLIFIDDYTLKEVGQEPFPRDLQAWLIDTLSKEPYRAKQIGFDLLFAEKSKPEYDALLSSLTKEAGNVYHCFCFHFDKPQKKVEGLIERFSYPNFQTFTTSFIPSATSFTSSLPDILSAAKGAGHVNVFPDADGVVRRVPLVIEYRGKLYPNLALQMACDYLNISRKQIKILPGKYIILSNKLKIPIDKKGQMLINFASPELKGDSFIQVLRSAEQMEKGQNPRVNLYDYKDKIVLIGAIATGKGDTASTPLSPYYPGVEIFANVIDNILQQNFLTRIGMRIQGTILIVIGLVMGLFLPRLIPLKQILCSGILFVLYILTTLYAFWVYQLWIDLIAPVAVILFSYLSISLWSYVSEEGRLWEVIEELKKKILPEPTPPEPVKIDFRDREIRIGEKSIKKGDPQFMLLEHFLREKDLHWTSGYRIFEDWDVDNPKEPSRAFATPVSKLNTLLKRKIIESTRKGRRGKGDYQFILKANEYECNILTAERLIKEVNEDIKNSLPEQVETKLREAVKLDPGSIDAYWLLCSIDKGTRDERKRCFELVCAKMRAYIKANLCLEKKEEEGKYIGHIRKEKDRLVTELQNLKKKKEKLENRYPDFKKDSILIGLLKNIRECPNEDESLSSFEKLKNFPLATGLIKRYKILLKKDEVLDYLFVLIKEDKDIQSYIALKEEPFEPLVESYIERSLKTYIGKTEKELSYSEDELEKGRMKGKDIVRMKEEIEDEFLDFESKN